jgi:predicted RNase H-like HicB family nuclease
VLKIDLQNVKRAEIWGIVVVACFNLALLAVAIRFGGLGPILALVLVVEAQVCSFWVIYLLLRVRLDRDYMEDVHRVHGAQSPKGESRADTTKQLTEAIEGLTKALMEFEERVPCLKNLPPL